jgi:hypothetical protein
VSTRSRSAAEPAHLIDPLIAAWFAITALGSALLLYLPTALTGTPYGADFAALHAAAARVAVGELPGYAGAPLLPYLLAPLGSMVIELAWITAGTVTLAIWTVGAFLLVREAGVRDRGTARLLGLAVAVLPWFFAPATGSLLAGGTALLGGLAAAGLFLALDSGRGIAAGLCLVLALVLAPQAALLVIFLAGRRDLRTLSYALLAGGLLIGLTIVVLGAQSSWNTFPGELLASLSIPPFAADHSLAGELATAGVIDASAALPVRYLVLGLCTVAALLLGAGAPLWVGGPITLLLGALALPSASPAAITPLLATGILLALWTQMPGFLDRLLRPATFVMLLVAGWCAALGAAGAGPWFWAAAAAPFLLMAIVARSPRSA